MLKKGKIQILVNMLSFILLKRGVALSATIPPLSGEVNDFEKNY